MSSKYIEVVKKLSTEEIAALAYFIRYRSVGDLLAFRELRSLYGVKDPARVLLDLVNKGLLTRGIGCYTINWEVLDDEEVIEYVRRRMEGVGKRWL